jgi:hypothetical protein
MCEFLANGLLLMKLREFWVLISCILMNISLSFFHFRLNYINDFWLDLLCNKDILIGSNSAQTLLELCRNWHLQVMYAHESAIFLKLREFAQRTDFWDTALVGRIGDFFAILFKFIQSFLLTISFTHLLVFHYHTFFSSSTYCGPYK